MIHDYYPPPEGSKAADLVEELRGYADKEFNGRDVFWKRKAAYLSAMKLLSIGLPDEAKGAFSRVLGLDIMQDLADHFPNDNPVDLLTKLMVDADKIVGWAGDNMDKVLDAMEEEKLRQTPVSGKPQ